MRCAGCEYMTDETMDEQTKPRDGEREAFRDLLLRRLAEEYDRKVTATYPRIPECSVICEKEVKHFCDLAEKRKRREWSALVERLIYERRRKYENI